MLIGYVGMLLSKWEGWPHNVALIYACVWLVGALPYVLVSLGWGAVKVVIDTLQLWNPAREWGWTTFDAPTQADRKFARRLGIFGRDDLDFVEGQLSLRTEDARSRLTRMKVFASLVASVLAFVGYREKIVAYLASLIAHIPGNMILLYVALGVAIMTFLTWLFRNPSDVLGTQLKLAAVAVEVCKRRNDACARSTSAAA